MRTTRCLRWNDVDPGRPFDSRAVRPKLEELLFSAAGEIATGRRAPRKLWQRAELQRGVDRVLIVEYGAWAAGWCWGSCQGGPLRCGDHRCPTHALYRALFVRHFSVTELADLVIGQLEEWRRFLAGLASMFAELREESRAVSPERAIERAAARIQALVLDLTRAEDAWPGLLSLSLCWFCEFAGFDADRARPIVRSVVRGRFNSWSLPSVLEAEAAFSELAFRLVNEQVTPETPDALEDWLRVRTRMFQPRTLLPAPPARLFPVQDDGHERYIETRDRARDPERARRMRSALAMSRVEATRGGVLDFDALTRWQRVVLGIEHVELRSMPAFAKGGRERYGALPNLRARFETALHEASLPSPSPAERAARAYLDVCFFHPFTDGNARAARLALDFVLTKEGFALHSAEPVFSLARDSGDPYGTWSLSDVVREMLGELVGPV